MSFRELMKEKGYTQKKLEKETGIGQPLISKLCNGKYHPTLKQAFLIEEKLGIPIDFWKKN